MQELDAAFELFVMLIRHPPTAILFSLLLLAATIDYRTYRIPNWLTGAGVAIGLIYSAVAPFGFGHGIVSAFGGMLVGFLLMAPPYALRAMGAGDVKLMAMVGVFLGPQHVLYAAVAACVTGGVAALGFGLAHRALGRMLLNVKNTAGAMAWFAIGGMRPDAGAAIGESVGKLPFGVSIAAGTIAYMTARQFGFV